MRNLPVIATVKHTFETVVNNISAAFKFSWAWILVCSIPTVYLGFVASNDTASLSEKPVLSMGIALLSIAIVLLQMFAFASIAVNWHRFVLLNEIPVANKNIRIDQLVWRYFWNVVAIGLLVLTPVVIFTAIFMPFFLPSVKLGANPGILDLWPFYLIFIISGGFAYRISLKLPAVALGNKELMLSDGTAYSKGNFFRLVVFNAILMFAFAILDGISDLADMYLFDSIGFIGSILSGLSEGMILWITSIVGISALTSLYGFFVEGREI